MLNPVHLQTLVTVVRTGSFADAARELGYTGSAVSQQVAALERSTKVILFDRSARTITPTPAAEQLADLAREPLTLLKELEDAVSAMAAGDLGTLRIGSFPTASKTLLPLAFRRFLHLHPKVTIKLGEGESEELLSRLLDGETDVSLHHQYNVVPRSLSANVIRIPLLDEHVRLLVPAAHPLADRELVHWQELEGETWVATRERSGAAEALRRLCAAVGFEPDIAFFSNDYDVVRQFVRSGLGLALVPQLTGGETDGTRILDHDHPELRRRTSVLHRRDNVNPVVTGIVRALRQGAADLSGEYVDLVTASPPDRSTSSADLRHPSRAGGHVPQEPPRP